MSIALALSIVAAVGVVIGWLRWARPRLRHVYSQVIAGRDQLIGREAVIDSITGAEIAPYLPGVGVRMSSAEEQMGKLTEAVSMLAGTHVRLDDHDERIRALELGAAERIANRVDSVEAWRAMSAAHEAERPDPPA